MSKTKRTILGLYSIIIIILIVVWGLLAVGRTTHNLSKLYTEEREWVKLSVDQKREKFFGRIHEATLAIDQATNEKDTILILSEDYTLYYYARYLLIPKKIYIENPREIEPKKLFIKEYSVVVYETGSTKLMDTLNFKRGKEIGNNLYLVRIQE